MHLILAARLGAGQCSSPASYDVIYSQACFEHFADPQRSIDQLARLLRPGGYTSHQVDLRDHRDYERPFDSLRHSDTLWRLASSNSPMFVRNRWRVPNYCQGFLQAGLDILSLEATASAPLPPELHGRLHPRIQRMDPAEMAITSFQIVAAKPMGESAPG
jgi:SAM-dependent methyltransferase